jgi:hypothetical protein
VAFHSLVREWEARCLYLAPNEHPPFYFALRRLWGLNNRACFRFSRGAGGDLAGVYDNDVINGAKVVLDGGVLFVDEVLVLVFEDKFVGVVFLEIQIDDTGYNQILLLITFFERIVLDGHGEFYEPVIPRTDDHEARHAEVRSYLETLPWHLPLEAFCW